MYRFKLHRSGNCFSRAAYAVSVDDAHTFERLHVQYFYGTDGRTERAKAIAWARNAHRRQSLPSLRDRHLNSRFPRHGDTIPFNS